MSGIKIISSPSKEKPFLVLYKPKNLPSAPLFEDDKKNAFSLAALEFPLLLDVLGSKKVEHGLLHRLDTATDGLVLIAASQEFYDFMILEQKNDRFIKYYRAECDIDFENPKLLDGFPPFMKEDFQKRIFSKDFTKEVISSYFRSYSKGGREVRPVTKDSGRLALKKVGKEKLYTTEILSAKKTESGAILDCRISQGFRHQVRSHLAWAGLPVKNDLLYNAKERIAFEEGGDFLEKGDFSKKGGFEYAGLSEKLKSQKELKFSSVKIEFFNPILGKMESFSL